VLAATAHHSLLFFDKPMERTIRSIHQAWFNTLMHAWSYLGNRYVLAPLTLLLAIVAWRHCRWFAIAFFLALPGAFVVEVVFKAIVARPRPVSQGFGSSFPSGDVIAATVFWGLLPPLVYLVTRNRRLWLVSIPVVTLVLLGVGLERIYFGAHWPSDVLGGYLGGAMFLFAAEWALRHPAPSKKTMCDVSKHNLTVGRRRQGQ
jgi:undecaprenyl-diphosphatase